MVPSPVYDGGCFWTEGFTFIRDKDREIYLKYTVNHPVVSVDLLVKHGKSFGI